MISSDDHSLENLRNRDIDELEIINELFVLYLFELHLSDEMKINLALSESKAFQLAYDLLYRQVNVDGWISIFQLIKDCCYPKFVKGVPFLDKI